jgi:hypothetical protein
MDYDIRKHGVFSGRWTLEQAGMVVAESHKTSAMFRTFEIAGQQALFTVQAESALTRAFEIMLGGQVVGDIRPAHAFTRRVTIRCSDMIPEHLQLFFFCLVALTWRRRARNNSGRAS